METEGHRGEVLLIYQIFSASTSEIFSVVGRTWAGTNLPSERRDSTLDREREKEERRGDAPGVKSEFGISSEESGYKTDEAPLRPVGSSRSLLLNSVN